MGGVISMTQVPAVHLKCVAIIFVFLVQAASVKFVPIIPIAPPLRVHSVAVAVDADLTVWVIHVLVTQIVDSMSTVVTENARTIQSVMILQPLSSAQCVAFSSSLVCSPCAFTTLAEGVEFTMEE